MDSNKIKHYRLQYTGIKVCESPSEYYLIQIYIDWDYIEKTLLFRDSTH